MGEKNMRVCNRAILLSVLFALTACSTAALRPQLSDDEMRAKLRSSRVVVHPVSQPIMLSERTKAQATGNFLFSSLLSSAVGSAGAAGNPRAMQANADIAQTFGQQMNQALPADSTVAHGAGVDGVLAARLAEYFSGMETAPASGDEVVIDVSARKWELGYESYLGSSDYALTWHFDAVASALQPEGVHVLKSASCQGKSTRRMPLDDWRADDYREVDAAAEDIVASCFDVFLKGLALAVPEDASQNRSAEDRAVRAAAP